jgi:hypothetical protein
MAEPDAGLLVDPHTLIVRPAMRDRIGHARNVGNRQPPPGEKSRYSTHIVRALPMSLEFRASETFTPRTSS